MRRVSLTTLLLAALVPAGGCSGSLEQVSRVVIVTLDTTRADRLGCYGYEVAETPNLDAFAAESVLFEQAVSSVPTTLPSHATMFTGYHPLVHGVRYNIVFRLGQEATTLAEVLGEAGYGSVAIPAAYVVGEDFGLDQGFDTFHAPPKAEGNGPPVDRLASEGVDLALDWLSANGGRPSFVWLHFYDPHHPYMAPFPYSSRFRERPYDGEIAYTDAQFGRLMEALRADPEWDSTLVVVAGDHGEGLNEHRERYHSQLVYETTQHVPLIIRAPGARPRRVSEPVGLVDLMPTVLDLVGLPVPEGLQGISLRPGLRGAALPSRDLYFESLAGALNYGWVELKGLRRGNWKLIDSPDPELFDLAGDPAELSNLASLEPERLAELRRALADLESAAAAANRLAEEAQDPVIDAETEQFLASLGYVAGGAGGSAPENAPHPRDLIDLEGEMRRARGAINGGNWSAVEQVASYVLERDPTNKWAVHNLAMALLYLDRVEEAQKYAAEQLRLYPDSERSYVMLARTHRGAKDYEGALSVLERGLEALPGSEWLTYLSLVAAFDAGRDDVCAKVTPNTVFFPDSFRLMVLQARCLSLEGRADEAIVWLKRAVGLGFEDLELLEEADDFSAVVTLPAYRELLGRDAASEGAEDDAAEADEAGSTTG